MKSYAHGKLMRRFPWLSLLVLLCTSAGAMGQIVQGRWVDESQQRIEATRKTELRVIVLGADGKPAGNTQVKVQQVRHDFPMGFTLGQARWPRLYDADAPVWRCFNAVSLDLLTDWPTMAPTADQQADLQPLHAVIHAAHQRGMAVRWGGVISADVGRLPDWVAPLQGERLQAALEQRIGRVLGEFGWAAQQFDLYTQTATHRMVEDRLGTPALRKLFERAKATAPQASVGVCYSGILAGQRLPDMVQSVTALKQAFFPFDQVVLEEKITGIIVQAPLARALDWIAGQQLDVVITGLEVGGGSPAAAAVNFEIVLRTLFAEPAIKGIWVGSMQPDREAVPHASLLDAEGQPTAVGEVLDHLFHKQWWTDLTLQTDEIGNARARVFTGVHRISALLEDGTTLETTVYLPRQVEPRIVLLQPGE